MLGPEQGLETLEAPRAGHARRRCWRSGSLRCQLPLRCHLSAGLFPSARSNQGPDLALSSPGQKAEATETISTLRVSLWVTQLQESRAILES